MGKNSYRAKTVKLKIQKMNRMRLLKRAAALEAERSRTSSTLISHNDSNNSNWWFKGHPNRVSSLAKLCQKAIKKFKLLPEPKKFTPPESFSVVGGKPLRKRSERLPPEPKKKWRNPLSLAMLCRIVVQKYNLLPDCEETIHPYGGTSAIVKKKIPGKRGRPKKEITSKEPNPKKSRKGRPRKNAAAATSGNDASSNQSFLRQSTFKRIIQVEKELAVPTECDPLRQDEEEYTIVIKEEKIDDEDSTHDDPVTVQVPHGTSRGMIINPLASATIPGPSEHGLMPSLQYVTVLMDEYQAFANNVAEQLRTLPPKRALLLQLDIQSMIDNEKQLLLHEQ